MFGRLLQWLAQQVRASCPGVSTFTSQKSQHFVACAGNAVLFLNWGSNSGEHLVCATLTIKCEPQPDEKIDRQSDDRTHRLGQTRETMSIIVAARDTHEDSLAQICRARWQSDEDARANRRLGGDDDDEENVKMMEVEEAKENAAPRDAEQQETKERQQASTRKRSRTEFEAAEAKAVSAVSDGTASNSSTSSASLSSSSSSSSFSSSSSSSLANVSDVEASASVSVSQPEMAPPPPTKRFRTCAPAEDADFRVHVLRLLDAASNLDQSSEADLAKGVEWVISHTIDDLHQKADILLMAFGESPVQFARNFVRVIH